MMDDPEPLTPSDCDLRDFPYMPLMVSRLRRSKAWLLAKRQPELGFYMMNLWTGSWHELPAASLEDDDDVLADIAMCAPARWVKLREVLLRGWTKCADGRWYHPVVAEQARETWDHKRKRREAGRIGNAVRWGSQSDNNGTAVAVAEGSQIIAREGKGIEGKKETTLRVAKKRSAVPADWMPDAKGQAYAEARGIGQPEVPKFRNYHAGKGSLMADWNAAWRTWCDNAVSFGKAPGLALEPPARGAKPGGYVPLPMSGTW